VAPGAALAGSWRVDRPAAPGNAAGPIGPDQVEAALQAVAAELDRVAGQARAAGRQAAADIVAVGALIAADPELVEAARGAAAGDDPVRALQDVFEGYAHALETLTDETLRERAADIRQIARRVLDHLAGTGGAGRRGRFVLVGAELGPADLLEHLGTGLAGAVGVRGGANSHAAIVARSVGVPLLIGVDDAVLELPDGTPLLVDADAGKVVADPGPSEVAALAEAESRAGERQRALSAQRRRPHVTADGERFELLCNVASGTEVRLGRDNGAEGIGLLRTELPFLAADRWPTLAEHRAALVPILSEASGWPVTVRLLDFANDKVPPFLAGTTAGLTALLDNPAALADQVRAVLAAGHGVRLRIMVPMVSAAAELREIRAVVETAARDTGVPPPPVGAMVETVAAVDAIGELCAAADFLSLGTNDLTAAVLELSRTDPRARPESTADPRVLELIARVVLGARPTGTPVSVCGDAASHPVTLPLLLGSGVRAFSVSCARLDETRYRLRGLDASACAALLAEALSLGDAAEVASLVAAKIEVPES
jgi:phosphoenolpyruvate-protein kinase (PTS system EI component)